MLTAVTPEGTTITNTYNGNGQRVAKQVDTETTKYVYIGSKVVLELDGAGNQTARNVQGTNLISRTAAGATYYYMYNGHGDVTALIDAAGNIQAAYYYDAFGNITETTGTADNPYKYAGYVYDEETKYYYLNARYYDPLNARFISEDTYRGDPNDPLSLNLYTYCKNNPLMYIDPTGHYTDYSQIDYAKEAARMNIAQTGAWKDVVDQRLYDIGTKYMGGITDLHVVTQILQTVDTSEKTASDVKSTATNTVSPSATSPTVPNSTTKTITSSKTTTVAPPVVSPVSDTRTAMQLTSSMTSDYFNEYGTAGYYGYFNDDWSAGYNQSDPTMWSVTQNFGSGLYNAGKDAVTGILSIIAHPIETAKNLGNAALHPIDTGKAIWNEVSTAFIEDVINGDADSRAYFAGRAVGEVVLVVVGTKGVDKAVKVVKATNGVKVIGEVETSLLKMDMQFADDIAKGTGEASNAFKYELLKKDLKYTERYGLDARRELPDGRIRYYDQLVPASKQGEMVGRRTVQELNPSNGNVRTWQETLDANGTVRQVRPQLGPEKTHYMFDQYGNYTGKW